MRQVGTLASRSDADRFCDYLVTLGISAKAEPSGDAWAVWIRDENQIDRTKQELREFELNPQLDRYRAAGQAAQEVRREEAEKARQARKNYHEVRDQWNTPLRRHPVTTLLIVTCVAIFIGLIPKDELWFSWPDIEAGQVWRLVTPALMHSERNPLHLVFNMLMLFQLGSLVELRLGSLLYLVLVTLLAIGSNYAQYAMAGPNFLGMSGVVYGLFGYAWIRGRLDPASGLYLRQDVVYWMLGWFLLCAFGVISQVANWAHGGGLVLGALFGALPELRRLGR